MSSLPLSVRLALWVTASWHGDVALEDAMAVAHPDIDHVTGDLARVSLWRDFGESALLVALPRPGDLTGMPPTSGDTAGEAAAAGECVFVPGMGGMLVPTLSAFGPEGDEGTAAAWTAYDSEPMARHVLEAIDLGDLERSLALTVSEWATALESVDGRPWSSGPRDEAERRLGRDPWGLPAGIPARAVRVMTSAARVAIIAEEGLRMAAAGPTLDVHSSSRREVGLRRLEAAADAALAGATNVAVMGLAGWRPA